VKTQRLYAQWNADASVTALVNTSGQVQERYLYDPYGSVTVTDASWNPRSGNQSSFGWRYLFQGGRLDTTTGWYDFRNRDLIPSEGRWAQRDPLGFGAGDLNLYRDTFNSPETYTDPAGLGLGSVILTGQWNPPAYAWDAAMQGYGQGYAQAYNDSAEAGSYVLAAGSYVPGPVGWVASGTSIALGTVLNPNDPDPNAPLMAAIPGPKGRPIIIMGRPGPVPRGPMARPVPNGPAAGPRARPIPNGPAGGAVTGGRPVPRGPLARPPARTSCPAPSSAPLRPEKIYTGSKKHGIKWKEGPATAKSLGKPQGQWSQADLDCAGQMAATLKPGEGATFPLPEGSTSVVHLPDGSTVPATHIWVRNNGTGTFHGYPKLGD
jgi:RHS repeat-associated protein